MLSESGLIFGVINIVGASPFAVSPVLLPAFTCIGSVRAYAAVCTASCCSLFCACVPCLADTDTWVRVLECNPHTSAGNFGTVFIDQSYWQSAIAAKPSATYKGYILGGLCWFAIPFTLATSLGLASRALDLPLTEEEAGAGAHLPNRFLHHTVASCAAHLPGRCTFWASCTALQLIAVRCAGRG